MISRLSKVAFLLVLISAFGQSASICVAQSAAQNQATIRSINQRLSELEKAIAGLQRSVTTTDGQKTDQRLMSVERAIAAAQINPNVTEEQKAYLRDVTGLKTEFDSIQTKLREAAVNLSGTQISIANHYFQIFVALIAISSVISAIAIFFIQKSATKMVLGRAKRLIEERIDDRVRYESSLTLARAYGQMGYMWWQYYEPDFQRLKREKNGANPLPDQDEKGAEVLREIRMARRLSAQGMQYNDILNKKRRKSDPRAWETQALLTNQTAYHLTTSTLFETWAGRPADSTKKEALRYAEQCLKLSQEEGAGELWFNLRETAIFAYAALGDPFDRKTAREHLEVCLSEKALSEKNFPVPPLEWRKMIYDEYFPMKGEIRLDPYGLGTVSEPK